MSQPKHADSAPIANRRERLQLLLFKEEFDQVKGLLQDGLIKKTEMNEEVERVFHELAEGKNYQQAIALAKAFELSSEDVYKVKELEWERLHLEKRYVEAARWAKENSISKFNVQNSAQAAFQVHLNKGEVDACISVYEEFSIERKEILTVTIEKFNQSFAQNDFLTAAMLGSRFELSRNRTYQAAIFAFINLADTGKLEVAFELIKKFNLFSNDVIEMFSENDLKKMFDSGVSSFFVPLCERGKISMMIEFIKLTDMINLVTRNVQLKEFKARILGVLVSTHNKLMQEEKIKHAKLLKDSLDLLSRAIPAELSLTIIDTAQKYHFMLLDNFEFEKAVAFKDEYNLYTATTSLDEIRTLRGKLASILAKILVRKDEDGIKFLLREYDLPNDFITKAMLEAVQTFLDSNNFEDAFDLCEKYEFEINTDTQNKATAKYSEVMKTREYLLAVEIARNFRLNPSFIEEASYKAWLEKFDRNEFAEALLIKNRYNVSKGKVYERALASYKLFRGKNDFVTSSMLRKNYALAVGVKEILIEYFHLFFIKPK